MLFSKWNDRQYSVDQIWIYHTRFVPKNPLYYGHYAYLFQEHYSSRIKQMKPGANKKWSLYLPPSEQQVNPAICFANRKQCSIQQKINDNTSPSKSLLCTNHYCKLNFSSFNLGIFKSISCIRSFASLFIFAFAPNKLCAYWFVIASFSFLSDSKLSIDYMKALHHLCHHLLCIFHEGITSTNSTIGYSQGEREHTFSLWKKPDNFCLVKPSNRAFCQTSQDVC